MWFVPIIIALTVLIIFWFILSAIYNKAFNFKAANIDNIFNKQFADRAILFDAPYLKYQPKFINIKCNLILKFVIFLILSLIVHYTNSITIIEIIYILFTAFELSKILNRRSQYKNVKYKEELKPVFYAFTFITVYQILLNGLIFVVYLLNK